MSDNENPMGDSEKTDSAVDRMLDPNAMIAANRSLKSELFHVPEWGGMVKLGALSKQKQIQIRRKATHKGEIDGNKLEFLIFKEGLLEPVMEDWQVDQLFQGASGPVNRVIEKIGELSGMGDDVEDIEADLKS